MAFLSYINIVGSGLTAEQLRLDIIAENVTNSQTTRTENGGGAYRRKVVVFQAESGRNTFREAMARAAAGVAPNGTVNPTAGGVRVVEIGEDDSPMKLVYDPAHPDMVKEIADAMAATRAFASNVTVFNTMKSVISSGLEIGK